MNTLYRELAPVSAAAWAEIERQATSALKLNLAARRLVDFVGPLGIAAAAVNVGRVQRLPAGPGEGIEAAARQTLPLVELRAPFELARAELDAIERGARDPDLQALVQTATRLARAEDAIVFHGYRVAGMRGISEASPHAPLPISQQYERYPGTVAEATRRLREAGIEGPYAIALGPRCYEGLMQATERGGYPIIEIVHRLLEGPAVWAPGVNGAVVLSMRGGDFELTVGQDVSIGYLSHTETHVRFYLLESLAFRVLTPEAAVALVYA
jgi:uncharacterized linocin/CFP29 family protein